MFTKYLLRAVTFFMIFAAAVNAQDNLEKGMNAVKKGDYLGALNLLKGVSKDSYNANLYYGIALYQTGSVKDAEKFLKDAVKKDDERPEAYSVLGELYTSQKNYGEASSQFVKAKKYLPLNKTKDDLEKAEIETIIDVLSSEAENFIADGKVDNAITSLTMAKTYDDKNPMIYVGLGDAYLARGAFDPAKTNYDQALKFKPNYAPALFGLGKISFKQKKYNAALENYIKSSEADNNFAPAFFEKGLMFYLLDKFTDAIEAFERYDVLVPGSPRGKTYLAKARYGKGEYDDAMTILSDVLAIDPAYSEANKYAAYVMIEKKDYTKAEEFFSKVKPEELNAEDYQKWSKIYVDKKEYTRAYELLDKALTLDPNDENTYFEYGKALFAEQKYGDARVKFGKAIELGILNVAAYVYAGICDFYLNEFEKGVEILTKSIELNPNIGSAYLWRANNYAGFTKNAEACADYQKYLTFEPNDTFAQEQVKKFCGQ
ncbi:MAG TPA: tetratricopeptide repeat protein [Ignavibacteria bacterium]|nr:tetratricopeptide repeat protein [Ignavibacteria bacterium]